MGLKQQDVELFNKEIELVKLYRQNPILAAQDLLRVELAVPQQAVLMDMWFKSHVIFCAGRGTGKTFLDAVFSCLWAMLFPGQKVGLLAPSFRQAKMIFAEVDKLWHRAPLLQEATANPPTLGSDKCYLRFKQAGLSAQSMIEAVPLGDGNKIRGSRYYCIIADEFAQIPVEIFNAVIRPMGATVADPMENVKRMARIDALIKSGKASKEDFEEGMSNKVIMTSSAYFTFNHMYEQINSFNKVIAEGDKKHAVHNVSYRDMPKGFLDEDNIKNSRATLSSLQFRMEYEALWEADSAGVFKASLVEACKNLADFTVKLKGDSGKQYIIGVDPARASDGFAICVIEVGSPNKVVAAWEFFQIQYPLMSNFIIKVCDTFNPIAVHMDVGAGGGGLAMKDLLAEEKRYGAKSLLDIEDETTLNLNGRRILYCFKPSPQSNAEAVYATLSLMENKLLAFPKTPIHSGQAMDELDAQEVMFETILKLQRQLMLIEVTQSKSGVAHFDVPAGGGHANQKKDLYTSFILAAKKIHDFNIMSNAPGAILECGIVENLKLPEYPSRNVLASNLDVLHTPINSWSYRKTFKPSGK